MNQSDTDLPAISTTHYAALAEVPQNRPFVAVRQLRRRVAEGRISCSKAGRPVVIDLSDVHAMVENNRVDDP
jgi:hypothetical protein